VSVGDTIFLRPAYRNTYLDVEPGHEHVRARYPHRYGWQQLTVKKKARSVRDCPCDGGSGDVRTVSTKCAHSRVFNTCSRSPHQVGTLSTKTATTSHQPPSMVSWEVPARCRSNRTSQDSSRRPAVSWADQTSQDSSRRPAVSWADRLTDLFRRSSKRVVPALPVYSDAPSKE
jgi:hypothetical protein